MRKISLLKKGASEDVPFLDDDFWDRCTSSPGPFIKADFKV